MESVILPKNVSIENIKFGAVKTQPNGGKSIYISHNNSPLIIQTPEMRCPFGLSKWDKTEKGSDGIEKDSFKYDLLLGFDGKDTRENIQIFYDKLEAFDKMLITAGVSNSMNWLGKKITSEEVIGELFTPMIRHSRDKNTGEINDKYAPTFKVTIPYRDGKFQCDVFNKDRSEVDLTSVNLAGARVTAIIQCVGIWVVGKKYGCSFKVLQMMITLRTNLPKFAFLKVEDEKHDPESDEEHHVVKKNIKKEEIIDSDEDEKDEKEEEDELENKN
jgi:hypothetical protein